MQLGQVNYFQIVINLEFTRHFSINTVNYRLKALLLYNFVRGFRHAYKQRGLYTRGLIAEMKNTSYNYTCQLIEISFSVTVNKA